MSQWPSELKRTSQYYAKYRENQVWAAGVRSPNQTWVFITDGQGKNANIRFDLKKETLLPYVTIDTIAPNQLYGMFQCDQINLNVIFNVIHKMWYLWYLIAIPVIIKDILYFTLIANTEHFRCICWCYFLFNSLKDVYFIFSEN